MATFQISLQELTYISVNNQRVFDRYAQLQSVLKSKLGTKVVTLLSTPYLTEQSLKGNGVGQWMAEEPHKGEYQMLSELSGDLKSEALDNLQKITSEVLALADQLESEGTQPNLELSKILKAAMVVPGEEYIRVAGDQITLIAWGFRRRDKPIYSPVKGRWLVDEQLDEDQNDSEPAPLSDDEGEELLPKQPRVIVPIDPEDIILDDDRGEIVSNRINFVLIGEDNDLLAFAKAFKYRYPDRSYKFIYYDDITYRLQVRVPANERRNIIDTIKGQLNSFEFLVMPEVVMRLMESADKSETFESQKKTWHHTLIKTRQAWSVNKGSHTITIGVIDDGFDLSHPAFQGRIVNPYHVVNRTESLSSASGHGTHVAGIALGAEVNGVHGVAPECRLMPVQVSDANGIIITTAVIDGLIYAITKGCDVINMSVGESIGAKYTKLPVDEQKAYAQFLFKDDEQFWDKVFTRAVNKNSIVILAAGNDDAIIGMDPRARSGYVIKVSAVDHGKTKADFSNHGELSTLSSPGVEVYSSWPGAAYKYENGTSMAAPVVAGAVALLKSKNKTLSLDDVVKILQTTGIDPITPKDKPLGRIIQIDKALGVQISNGFVSSPKPVTPIGGNQDPGGVGGYRGTGGSGGSNNGGCLGIWPPSRGGCLRALLIFLLFVLLIFLFSSLFRACSSSAPHPYLPPDPGYIPPIDSSHVIKDPDSIRTIVSDRLNIAFTGESNVIEEFASDFKEVYPSDEYQIIYYDTTIRRIQLRIPEDQRVVLKKNLKTKFPQYEMLIWEESLFSPRLIPNDPMISNPRQSWYLEKIRAYPAWDITMGNSELVVAVIDNGFDTNHPEIRDKIYKSYNPFDRSEDVSHYSSSIEGYVHGTHVAATAVATANNGLGIVGIAPNCQLMPIKVADDNGMMPSSAIIDGILFAIHQGADVINISLGMIVNPRLANYPPPYQERIADTLLTDEGVFWDQLMDMAYQKNVVIVTAAGNDDVTISLDPMKRTQKAIIVSALDTNLDRASFSNFGEESTISAPGVEIYSAVPGNSYEYLQGTSMASPIVAGAVALVKTIHPSMDFIELVDLLQSTGIPVQSGNKEIGNLLQLDVLLGATRNKRDELPSVACPDKKRIIDSLLVEIEKIRRSCPEFPSDTLAIPESPNNLDFAMGRWKSTTDLFNAETLEPVTLYFDFNAAGTGLLTVVEEDGNTCTGPLEISLDEGRLLIDQTDIAQCAADDNYNPYHFACEPDSQGRAECYASNQTKEDNTLTFNLVKVP